MNQRLSTAFAPELAHELLAAGCADLHVPLSTGQAQQLIDYLALLSKWNPVYKLTAITQTEQMVSHHLLDSLAVLPILVGEQGAESISVLDVGSGGGMPGVIWAIAQADWAVHLIDPVHKKTAFLSQVKAELQLSNLHVHTGKVEEHTRDAGYDIITARAFASLHDLTRAGAHVLKPTGAFVAMKGVAPTEELAELTAHQAGRWRSHITPMHVPQLQAQRHLVHLYPTPTEESPS